MQLDADEDGEPFFKPSAIAPAPLHNRKELHEGEQQQHSQDPSTTGQPREEGESQQAAAAIAIIEPDD